LIRYIFEAYVPLAIFTFAVAGILIFVICLILFCARIPLPDESRKAIKRNSILFFSSLFLLCLSSLLILREALNDFNGSYFSSWYFLPIFLNYILGLGLLSFLVNRVTMISRWIYYGRVVKLLGISGLGLLVFVFLFVIKPISFTVSLNDSKQMASQGMPFRKKLAYSAVLALDLENGRTVQNLKKIYQPEIYERIPWEVFPRRAENLWEAMLVVMPSPWERIICRAYFSEKLEQQSASQCDWHAGK
jgi:hypothetical protein